MAEIKNGGLSASSVPILDDHSPSAPSGHLSKANLCQVFSLWSTSRVDLFGSLSKMLDESLRLAVATGLAIIGLVSVPAVSSLALQLTTREPKQDTYEDEDGKATPESVKAYSAKWPKTFIVFFAILGSSTSVATAILTSLNTGNNGLFLDNWLSTSASVSPNLKSQPAVQHNPESDHITTASHPFSSDCHSLRQEIRPVV